MYYMISQNRMVLWFVDERGTYHLVGECFGEKGYTKTQIKREKHTSKVYYQEELEELEKLQEMGIL